MRLAPVVTMLLALGLLLRSSTAAATRCDPTTDPDQSDITNARAAVAANCDCAAATTHGAYVSCAARQIDATLVNRSCRGHAKRCAGHSTCGKTPGSVTCCRTKNGKTKCGTTRDAASCAARGGTPGACTSCCDACPSPGSGPSCATTITTSTTTTIANATTTTTTSGDATQCCVRTVTCGPFDMCQVVTTADCATSGIDVGPGDCTSATACAYASTTTPPSACCMADQCVFTSLCQCSVLHGQFRLFEDCTPNPCVPTTTTLP